MPNLPFLQALIVFGIAFAAALTARVYFLRWLRTKGPAAAEAAETLAFPAFLWSLTAALVFAVRFANLSGRNERRTEQAILVFVIISLTFVADAMVRRLLRHFAQRKTFPLAVAGLSLAVARILVYAIGSMLLLRHFNISITPMVTALGVSGLAVALALQDTLSNFFAGIHIVLESPVSVGDWIRLGPGEEGAVTDIGWRTTRILTPADNMLVIPNNKISTGILTNFSLPDRNVTGEVAVLASHQADPDELKTIAIESALETKGVLLEPPPVFVPDPGITATHLQFKLIFRALGMPAAGAAKAEIAMKIMRRMRTAGIKFPEGRL